jgi:hypothetical protein
LVLRLQKKSILRFYLPLVDYFVSHPKKKLVLLSGL